MRPRQPNFFAIASTRVGRSLTRPNSAATKNPFNSTSPIAARISSSPSAIATVALSICATERFGSLQVCIHRGVIGRQQAFLFLAKVAIDLDGLHALRDREAREHQIDAKPLSAVEGTAAVVPPRKRLLVRILRTEDVDQT